MMRNLRKTGIPVKLDLTLPRALLWVISKITYTKYVTQCLATINVTFLPMAFLLFSPYLIQPSIWKNLKFLGLRPEEIQVTPWSHPERQYLSREQVSQDKTPVFSLHNLRVIYLPSWGIFQYPTEIVFVSVLFLGISMSMSQEPSCLYICHPMGCGPPYQ